MDIRRPAKRLIRKLQDAGLSKRLLPEPNLASKFVNGMGVYVPAVCRLVINYNVPRPGAGGDSEGMVEFIQTRLKLLAKKRPYAEIIVAQRSGKPEVVAYYNNGSFESVETPKWKIQDIEILVNRLCDSRGPAHNARQYPSPVKRGTGSRIADAAPNWNPFEAETIFKP
ncbi:hypothetical protein BC833DRAFT_561778 [Globomyces pollinis-pini]|nr:hypothetical protein BC833DRAFT_561778 [Globomyces pollinis-pini]KAJ3000670.1 hypothetical protein HDV02_004355 [Globomyces sp. JEL0801]